jgi:hypothetical protein
MDNEYLGHWDLEDDGKYNKYNVTIEGFSNGEITGQNGKEKKTFVKFKEFPKKMICNITNFERLQTRFGNFYKESWIGQVVVLGVEKVSSPKGKRDALRISKNPPIEPKKETISDERLAKAIESKYPTEKLLAMYELTAEQRKQYGL